MNKSQEGAQCPGHLFGGVKRLIERGRDDDSIAVIEKRHEQFKQLTQPMLDYLKKETVFFDINGNYGIEAVTDEIYEALKIKRGQR